MENKQNDLGLLAKSQKKLTQSKKLAGVLTLIGAATGALVGKLAHQQSREIFGNARLEEYASLLNQKLVGATISVDVKYVQPKGILITLKPDEFLAALDANKVALGENYEPARNMFLGRVYQATQQVKYGGNVDEMAMATGLGAGVASFLLISAIPTTRYLYYRHKYKKLEKQNSPLSKEQLEAV